jgi:hypothetical protein
MIFIFYYSTRILLLSFTVRLYVKSSTTMVDTPYVSPAVLMNKIF